MVMKLCKSSRALVSGIRCQLDSVLILRVIVFGLSSCQTSERDGCVGDTKSRVMVNISLTVCHSARHFEIAQPLVDLRLPFLRGRNAGLFFLTGIMIQHPISLMKIRTRTPTRRVMESGYHREKMASEKSFQSYHRNMRCRIWVL